MKKYILSIIFVCAVTALSSCGKDPIDTYHVKNSAVVFKAKSNSFSLKGMTADSAIVKIPVTLVGPATDYVRQIGLEISDSTAVEGTDYSVLSSQIDSGALGGNIVIKINKLKDGVGSLCSTFKIVPNEYFREGYPSYSKSLISWSEIYVRPTLNVWHYWYLIFSNGYSQNLHKLIIEELGEEVEHYTMKKVYAESDTSLIYKLPTWWYSASRQLRDAVEEHDKANPGNPYMHSSDYEKYDSYVQAVGEGTKPETIPTILETLNVF